MGDLHEAHNENLLWVEFQSCTVHRSGTLDRQRLQILCEKLNLDEKTLLVANSLITKTKTRVSFAEFRDCIRSTRNKTQDKTESPETKKTEKLPEREISPKFVFGRRKKYGPKTRPKGAQIAAAEKNNVPDSEPPADCAADLKSDVDVIVNAQHPKKRRTALSDSHVALQADEEYLVEHEIQPEPAPDVMLGTTRDNEVGRLSKIMEDLNISSDGFINKTDLALICDNVGMGKESKKVAAGIFNNLNLDENNCVSCNVFLHLYIKSLESNDKSDTTDMDSDEPQFNHNHSVEEVLLGSPAHGDKMYSWEELELNLDGEKLEQANNELSKLRPDIVEANECASLLDQGVDDNNTQMKSSRKNEVKQKGRLQLKSVPLLTSTLSHKCEMMAQNIRDLEERVCQSEELDMKRHASLLQLTKELRSAQIETVSLEKQLAKSKERCRAVNREMVVLVGMHRRSQGFRAKKEQEQVRVLKKKLQGARNENTSLRDSNDKLTMMLESLKSEIATLSLKAVPEKQGQYDKEAGSCCLIDDLSTVVSAGKRPGPHAPPAASSEDNSSNDEPLSVLQQNIRHFAPDTAGMNGMQIHTPSPSGSILNLTMVSPYDTLPSGSPSGGSAGMQSLSDSDQSPAKTVESSLRAENKRLKKRVRVLAEKVDKRNEMIVENVEVCEAENNHRLKEFLEQEDFFPSPQLPYTVSQITEEYSSSTKELSEFENTKEQLEQHCRDLKSQLDEVKVEIVKILSERNACSKENCALKSHISDLKTSLGHSLSLEESDNYYRVAFLSESPSLGTENIPASGEPSLELRSGVSEDCLVVKDSNIANTNDDKAVNSDESETLFLLKCEFAEQLSVVEENHMKEKIELLERCTNLESSIEMLRQEYEKCEDYWASKLEEERVLYDKEQRTLDKKYKKILAELKEYDEYLSEDRPCTCRRLATIQESEKLESQVTAMEEECEELRKQIANERTDRANEHQLLIEQLNKEQIRCAAVEEQSYSKLPPRSDVVGDIDMVWRNADGNNHQPVYGHRSLDDQSLRHNQYMGHATTQPVQAFPGKVVHNIGVQWPEEDAMNGRQEPGMIMRQNPLSAGSADDLCAMLATRDLLSADISALRRQKELLTQSIQEEKNGKYGGGMGCGKQACCVDLTVLQTLNARWRQQEQQCRHLQNALKQRQRQMDMLLQHTWAQHKKEISDLEMVLEATQKTLQHQSLTCKEQVDRLVRNDVLVKDLYVENAYLVATVQRLEQRCQGLAQMTTDSISV